MKKGNFITLLLVAFSVQLLIPKDLFTIYNLDINGHEFNDTKYLYTHVDSLKDNILFLKLNQDVCDDVFNSNTNNFKIKLPFFNQSTLNIELEYFAVIKDDLIVTRYTNNGVIEAYHDSDIKTYKIINNPNLKGVLIFSNHGGVKAILKIDEEIYQIDFFNENNFDLNNVYFLTNVKDSPIDFEFICSHDELDNSLLYFPDINHRASSVSKCLDIAIEIDYFTYQSFSDYQEAVDWALEIIAVASEIFIEEINIGLKSSSAQIWEIEDPYVSFINAPQEMLMAVRDNWYTNESLVSVDRDLVHLFSQRNDTGTGGIAFLNGIGSEWNGYGFSSNLTSDVEYVNLPVPYFFWNIYCFTHELGHNLGAKHTQWCGWEEGPIDNCADFEEMSSGECQDYINNPQPQVGTIMSYCHTWSYDSGGGIMLKFHNLIKNTIMTYVEMQNVESCNNESIIILGCLDQNACNYNQTANTDDDSCLYADLGYDCLGNCLDDENQDGICDDTNLHIFNDLLTSVKVYPNPASTYLKFTFNTVFGDVISLKLFNTFGQLILYKSNLHRRTELDISDLPAGIYNAQLMSTQEDLDQQELLNKNIIIQ